MAAPGVRVQVDGSISEPAFDGQHLGEVSGETSLESPDFKSATGQYDICIAGGASSLTMN